jgi:hypothetical protein
MRRTITVAGDVHAGEYLSFRLNGVAYAHTFRGDQTLAEGLRDLRDQIVRHLKYPPYSVGIDGATLTFASSWPGWQIDLADLSASAQLKVAVDAPPAAPVAAKGAVVSE